MVVETEVIVVVVVVVVVVDVDAVGLCNSDLHFLRTVISFNLFH